MSQGDLVSQETYKIIMEGFQQVCKTESSQEETPVNRRTDQNYSGELQLYIRENRPSIKKSLDTHKVWDKNGIKTVFMAKDKMITIDIKYSRNITGQLWLRIHPLANSNKFENVVITSCKDHKKHLLKKVTNNNPVNVTNSIFELNDPTTVYENMSISSCDYQISARVRYINPETSVHLAFKCYNTCVEEFKRSLPKLIFSIESYNDMKDEYTVLNESYVNFKVCASPSRDYNCAAQVVPRKKLCLRNLEGPIIEALPQLTQKVYCLGKNKYYLKMLHEKEVEILEAMRNFNQTDIKKEVEYLEKRVLKSSSYHMSETGAVVLGAENGIISPHLDKNGTFHPKMEEMVYDD